MYLAPSGVPQNLSHFNASSSSFTLTWNAPPFEEQNGDIIGYTVQVTLHNSGPDEHSYVTVTVLSFTATSLTHNTRYHASVAAMTRVGTGPYSAPISIDTMKLGTHSYRVQ